MRTPEFEAVLEAWKETEQEWEAFLGTLPADSGKIEEAVSYMEDMAEKMSFLCSTNNPVVDILVGNKLGITKSMGIDVDCSLLLSYPCDLKDIDICIVLSNALDNAIQAVKSLDAAMEKYIHVSGRIQGDFLMMEIENSFHGKGAFKKGQVCQI